jgi:hypothetical protein
MGSRSRFVTEQNRNMPGSLNWFQIGLLAWCAYDQLMRLPDLRKIESVQGLCMVMPGGCVIDHRLKWDIGRRECVRTLRTAPRNSRVIDSHNLDSEINLQQRQVVVQIALLEKSKCLHLRRTNC